MREHLTKQCSNDSLIITAGTFLGTSFKENESSVIMNANIHELLRTQQDCPSNGNQIIGTIIRNITHTKKSAKCTSVQSNDHALFR